MNAQHYGRLQKMLTKTQRDELIQSIRDNVDFSYGDLSEPSIEVKRNNERFDMKEVRVVVQFLPIRGALFKSVSNVIGHATEDKQYLQYGYCQQEMCSITAYCEEFVFEDHKFGGRGFADNMIRQILMHVMKNWDGILRQYGAAIHSGVDIPIEDRTIQNARLGKIIYGYGFDVYLKTQFNWNKVPEDYEEGPLVKYISYKTHKDEDYKFIQSE